MGIILKKTIEFEGWFHSQTEKQKSIVQKRLMNIEIYGHFGDVKKLQTAAYDVCELRFKNGTRIYFSVIEDNEGNAVLVLMGGNKNGQSKDVKKAEKILSAWYEAFKGAFNKKS